MIRTAPVMDSESINTELASSKETLCFFKFDAAFLASQTISISHPFHFKWFSAL